MRLITAMALSVLTFPVGAQYYQELVFNQASELVPWCKSEAEARYIAAGITPYQWTSRYYDRSNVLYVEGKLRVNGNDVAVTCKIARGARERYATIQIDDPSLG